MSNQTAWSNSLFRDLDDDDEQDSDTDSRLSGSVMLDTVMRRLSQKGYRPEKPVEFTLDPIADQRLEHDRPPMATRSGRPLNGGVGGYSSWQGNGVPMSNGYGPGGSSSPAHHRRGNAAYRNSPKMQHRNFHGSPAHAGAVGRPRDAMLNVPHHYTSSRRKDPLSPVPENYPGFPMASSTSDVGVVIGGRGMTSLAMQTAIGHHSMEYVHRLAAPGRSPPMSRSPPMHRRPPVEGYRSPNDSLDRLARSRSEHSGIGSTEGLTHVRRSSLGSTSIQPGCLPGYTHPPPSHSPLLSSRQPHPRHIGMGGLGALTSLPTQVPPMPCPPPDDVPEHFLIGMSSSAQQEPNLNDVVDFLSHPEPNLVANAAAYLQHLAYQDDTMKAKIRDFGAIPGLINQLCNRSEHVQVCVLQALRNLSFGRANNENKLQIVGNAGLQEMMLLLKNSSNPTVRELVTNVLWNLSSSEDLKLQILQVCLTDLLEHVIIPHSGWTRSHPASVTFQAHPEVKRWSAELKNSLGSLRNVSSAGEAARKMLRSAKGMVDSLMWVVRAGCVQSNTDDKTVENAICILRNLSYHLESEVDPQLGAGDEMDLAWERELLREIDNESTRQEEHLIDSSRPSRGFLTLCLRPQTQTAVRRPLPRLSKPSNLTTPDASMLPDRRQPVVGVALLWQPEVVFPYLALIEKFSTADLLEAAAGSFQNLAACSWKWSTYLRHMVRRVNGLSLLIELVNHANDPVVRAATTALRNLSIDPVNKGLVGYHVTEHIITRLPFGQNNLGISEATTIALLCTLMELCIGNVDNARKLRQCHGMDHVVKLTHSKEHTSKIVFAAHKLCSLLYEIKEMRPTLKLEGWDKRQYRQLQAENSHHFEFERAGAPNCEVRRSHHDISKGNRGKEKEKKGKDKDRNHLTGNDIVLLAHNVSGSSLPSTNGLALPRQAPPHIEDITEPGYQFIEARQARVATPISPDSSSAHAPASTQDVGPVPKGLSMYAEINNPQILEIRKQSLTHSQTAQSEPRSTPTDARTVTPHDTASDSATAHDPASSDEQGDCGGQAVYAQVDMEKKRASRRRKQDSSQTNPDSDAIDSWV